MPVKNMILGRKLMETIAPAIGLEVGHLRRIVIDAPLDDVVSVYIELVGDERLLEINWAGDLKDGEIVMVESGVPRFDDGEDGD